MQDANCRYPGIDKSEITHIVCISLWCFDPTPTILLKPLWPKWAFKRQTDSGETLRGWQDCMHMFKCFFVGEMWGIDWVSAGGLEGEWVIGYCRNSIILFDEHTHGDERYNITGILKVFRLSIEMVCVGYSSYYCRTESRGMVISYLNVVMVTIWNIGNFNMSYMKCYVTTFNIVNVTMCDTINVTMCDIVNVVLYPKIQLFNILRHSLCYGVTLIMLQIIKFSMLHIVTLTIHIVTLTSVCKLTIFFAFREVLCELVV